MTSLIVLLIVVGIVAFVVAGSYNSLVRSRNETRNAWSQIDVQLKRRHNLIPNLVETVKGYAGHEKETLENVTAARSQAAGASGVAEQAQAESGLTAALGRLMVVVEQYPDLKANTNFLGLQEELTATENRIGFSRQHYNDSVLQYNNTIQSVPSNIVAGLFQFSAAEFFEIVDEQTRQVPKVEF
jgi:LemA protein